MAMIVTTGLAVAGVQRIPMPVANGDSLPLPVLASINPALSGHDRSNGTVTELNATSVSHLEEQLNGMGYDWEQSVQAVPRVRLASFPGDIHRVSQADERKRLFLQTMLPLVLLENEKILQEREHLTSVMERMQNGATPSAFDIAWMIDLRTRYGVRGSVWSPALQKELLSRVNVVPPSLALAMSAFESGWGTSRFAQEGNNLFGHWTFTRGTGMVPRNRDAGRYHELKTFPDLAAAVHGYLHNLNTHWAYSDFRRIRSKTRDVYASGVSTRLTQGLLLYSERGVNYIKDVTYLIRVNNLERFDRVELVDGVITPNDSATNGAPTRTPMTVAGIPARSRMS